MPKHLAVDHGHWAGVEYHCQLLEDHVRTDAYERAIRALVRPGMRVLDLGCGTGVLSMLCAKRGARVHAIESTPIIRVARALAEANGLADRIVFHEADAETLAPVEPVDLVVSDFMGRFVVDDGMLVAARNAARWLAPGGRFVPGRIQMILAPTACRLLPLEVFATGWCGLDLRAAIPLVMNSGWGASLVPNVLLGDPSVYATLDPPARIGPFDNTLRFSLRAGRLQALAGWFVAELAPGVVIDTGPGHDTHWGQCLFPLPAIDVADGDALDVHLSFDEVANTWHCRGAVGGTSFDSVSDPMLDRRPLPAAPPPPGGREVAREHHERALALFERHEIRASAEAWEQAVAALGPEEDDIADLLYENVGIARLNSGEPGTAVRALLRAGPLPQALELLPIALKRAGYGE